MVLSLLLRKNETPHMEPVCFCFADQMYVGQ